MRGAGWVDQQRLGVADVGEVRDHLKALDEGLAGLAPTRNPKPEDPPGSLGQMLLCQRVVRRACQTRVVDPVHQWMRREVLSNLLRILDVPVHADMER